MNRGLKLSFQSQPQEIGAPVTTVCRICLQTGKIPIYGDTKHEDVSEDIRIITGIVMRQADEFTNHLCERCNQLLWCAKVFRKVALESNKMLLTELNEINTASDDDNVASESDGAMSHNEEKASVIDEKYENVSVNDENVYEEYLEDEGDKEMNVDAGKRDDLILFVTETGVASEEIRSRCRSKRSAQKCTPKKLDDLISEYDDEQLKKLSELELPTGNEKTICSICGKSYTLRYIDQHMKIQHDPSSYTQCKICNKKFYTPFYRRHLFITHNVHLPKGEKNRRFCNICEKWFHTNGFKLHVASKHNGPAIKFSCDFCKKDFLKRNRYITHMQMHKNAWAAKCKLFPHLMKSEESANEEKILNELNEDPQETLANEQKGTECSQNPVQNEHVSIEDTENFEGNDMIEIEYSENLEVSNTIEQDSVEYTEDAEKHLNSNVLMQEVVIDQICSDPVNSENEKKIPCEYCNKMISAKSTFYFRHLFETHDIPLPQNEKRSTAFCDICHKSFHKKSLKNHIATQHNGPYEKNHCVRCGKDFYTKTRYDNHLIHGCKRKSTGNLEGFIRSLQKKKMINKAKK